MAADENYPNGTGNLPGSRQRRRGALPGNDDSGNASTPIGSQTFDQPAADGDVARLNVTERPKTPEAKVLGLRMSQQHYDTGTMMLDVLATQFRLDKRQIGELIVQYLATNRFDLFDYVRNQVGPAPVDLDFFTRGEEQS